MCGSAMPDEVPLSQQTNRRSSQFFANANNERSFKSESNFKEELEDNEGLCEEVNNQNFPIEQSLLQSNLSQEVEEINKTIPQFFRNLSGPNKKSAFQQVKKSISGGGGFASC